MRKQEKDRTITFVLIKDLIKELQLIGWQLI